jgi:hypothetical protein
VGCWPVVLSDEGDFGRFLQRIPLTVLHHTMFNGFGSPWKDVQRVRRLDIICILLVVFVYGPTPVLFCCSA